MRKTRLTAGACTLALLGTAAFGVAAARQADAAAPALTAAELALGRATLAANDGWAAATTGTTGGSAATDANVFVVSTRAELVTALGGDNATNDLNTTPKLIFIRGTINGRDDDAGKALTCDQFAAGTGYTQAAYLAAYDPAVWGLTTKVSGPIEDARVAAAKKQAAQVQLRVGSNTTIVGLDTAAITESNLIIPKGVDNVIIRNLTFKSAADCFPKWEPTDNNPAPAPPGNWNSNYDNVTLNGATHVWLDHNTFTDRPNIDALQPLVFGRPFQVHDGATDIINASDYVTLSWNDYSDHDKTNIIGGSDNAIGDTGKLRVTLHHNRYTDTLQRVPRVRFGQVDVYNNVFSMADRKPGVEPFVYALGVGKESSIYAENNFFALGSGYAADNIIYNWGGTKVTTKGNLVKVGSGTAKPVDLVAVFNAANPTKTLAADAGWTPTLRTSLDPASTLRKTVSAKVGAGRII